MKKGVRAATFGNKSYRGRKAMETGIRAAAFGNKTYQEKIVERGRKAATFSNKGSGCSSCFFSDPQKCSSLFSVTAGYQQLVARMGTRGQCWHKFKSYLVSALRDGDIAPRDRFQP